MLYWLKFELHCRHLLGYNLRPNQSSFYSMHQKDEIEEELSTMIEAQEVKVQETYEEQVNRARVETKDLSWIHLLGENIGV